MNSLSLVDDIIRARGIEGRDRINDIVGDLHSANNIILDIVEDINEVYEVEKITYEDKGEVINKIARLAGKFEAFAYIGGEFYQQADDKFFLKYEHAIKAMSNIKNEDITVENKIGATETTTIQRNSYSAPEQVKVLKEKVTIDDLLTEGEFDGILKSQYQAISENLKQKAALTEDKDDDEMAENFTYAEYIKSITTAGEFHYSYRADERLSLALDMIPIIGDAKGLWEAITGKDSLTGRELNIFERLLSCVSVVPFVGDGMKIGGTLIKGELMNAIGLFCKELAVNVAFYAGSKTLESLGINPLYAMLFYQGGRISYKNWDNIVKIFDELGIVDSATMTKREILSTLNSKWESIGEIVKSTEEVDGNLKVTLKSKINGITEVIFRKEDLSPARKYLCEGKCFAGDTLILTKEGLKRIDLIKAGDFVLSQCEKTGKVEYKRVLERTENPSYEFINIIINGETFRSTSNHLFRTANGWKTAEELQVGEEIKVLNGQSRYVEGKEVETVEFPELTYNIQVDDYNTYFIGEGLILVHNECRIIPLQKVYKDILNKIPEGLEKEQLKGVLTELQEKKDIKLIYKFEDDLQAIINSEGIKGKSEYYSKDILEKIQNIKIEGDSSNLKVKDIDTTSIYNKYITEHVNNLVSHMKNSKCKNYANNLFEYLNGEMKVATDLENKLKDIKYTEGEFRKYLETKVDDNIEVTGLNKEIENELVSLGISKESLKTYLDVKESGITAERIMEFNNKIENSKGDVVAIKKITSDFLNEIQIKDPNFHDKIFNDTIMGKDNALEQAILDEYYKLNPPKYNEKLVNEYINEVETITNRKLTDIQREALQKELELWKNDPGKYKRLTKFDTDDNRALFNSKKNKLIEEWQKNTDQEWPTYTEEVFDKNGKVIKRIGDKYDAHHLIENCYKGPAEWWNIYPAKFPNEHQGGIHGSGSKCRELFVGINELERKE